MKCEHRCKSDEEMFREAFHAIGSTPIPQLFREMGWYMALQACLMFCAFCGFLICMVCIGVQYALGYI